MTVTLAPSAGAAFRRVRAARWSLVAACAVAFGGCGEDEPSGETQTRPAPAAAKIEIARPVDGGRVRATQTPAGRLRARLRVRGSVRPDATVYLRASCRPQRCVAQPTAGRDGRWSASMTLTTTRAAPFVTIDASSQPNVSSSGSAVTTVELVGPRQARATSRASESQGSVASAPPSPPPPPPAARSATLPHDVLVIGDSLAVGMADGLRAALPGWRVRVDGKISRPLAEGMRILGAQADVPAIVALSLFTNDDPSATSALEQAVRATATRPGGCAVWATIARPPYNGVSYAAANRVLERLASDPRLRLRLVDWAAAVARSPSLVAGDGVHATPDGYALRARLYADAIRSCAGEA